MSCERCWLRLAMASWKIDLPASGSMPPVGKVMVVALGSKKVER